LGISPSLSRLGSIMPRSALVYCRAGILNFRNEWRSESDWPDSNFGVCD
jgi:hypothetical protein